MENYRNGYLLKKRNKPYKKRKNNTIYRTWLVQTFCSISSVLEGELKGNLSFDDNKYDERGFGGGGSGLSVEYMSSLNKTIKFHSMGAAEYEFDGLAKSVIRIEKNLGDYCINELIVDNYCIYVLANKIQMEDVKDALMELIINSQFMTIRQTKSTIYPDRMIVKNRDSENGGWDISNDFLFATDYKTLKDVFETFKFNKENNVEIICD